MLLILDIAPGRAASVERFAWDALTERDDNDQSPSVGVKPGDGDGDRDIDARETPTGREYDRIGDIREGVVGEAGLDNVGVANRGRFGLCEVERRRRKGFIQLKLFPVGDGGREPPVNNFPSSML